MRCISLRKEIGLCKLPNYINPLSARFPCGWICTCITVQHQCSFVFMSCNCREMWRWPPLATTRRTRGIHPPSCRMGISISFILYLSTCPFSTTGMDHQTRLFQMLNAATSPPPNKSAATASSPREPEPTPPPPSLQSVSLNDLFKGIQLQTSSPSVSANGSAAGVALEKASNASVAGPTIGLGHIGQHTPGTRSASQASVGSAPVSSPPPPSGPAQDQRAKLLGMLSFGGSGAGTPVNVTTSGFPTPLSGHVQPESQASAPFG